MDAKQDEVFRVYSRIAALRANLGDEGISMLEMGEEYDSLVDRLGSSTGMDLKEFNVGTDYETSDSKYYYTSGLKARMDGLLGYLRANMPNETVSRIGFSMDSGK
jgi:hypothetical protein